MPVICQRFVIENNVSFERIGFSLIACSIENLQGLQVASCQLPRTRTLVDDLRAPTPVSAIHLACLIATSVSVRSPLVFGTSTHVGN